jgi:uncharacterized membrane protein
MNKPLALLFACTSALWMLATAFSIDYNGWLAALFAVLACANVAYGFILKARLSRRQPRG